VVNSSGHEVYTRALAAGFEVPERMSGTLMGGGVLDMPETTGYLAGPDATGLLVQGSGVCLLLNIAVVPEARGHGLGRAMTARAIPDGFAAGADTAILISSAAGRALYESMGFHLTWMYPGHL
jgi:ribosomal protein S18 acetylase RimI-like enzyme